MVNSLVAKPFSVINFSVFRAHLPPSDLTFIIAYQPMIGHLPVLDCAT